MAYDGIINDDILRFDSLDAAEKITGKSYKDDKETAALGLLLAMAHNESKKRLLSESCDTYMGQPIDKYLAVVRDIGFKDGVEQSFPGSSDRCVEKYFLMWHPDGILLSFDTYNGDLVNGGSVYYNWAPDVDDWFKYTSSGRGDTIGGRFVWFGYHDAREALKYNLQVLRDHGRFLNPWVTCGSLFLGSYQDHKENSDTSKYESLNLAYLQRLPSEALGIFLPAYLSSQEAFKQSCCQQERGKH